MLKKIIVLFILFGFNPTLFAHNTDVFLTNNTNETIKINTTLTSEDHDFKQGKDWDAEVSVLEPYQTKKILWFSRNGNVKPKQVYRFDTLIQNLHYSESIKLRFIEKGKAVIGSKISSEITLPQENPRFTFNNTFEKISAIFWGNPKFVYLRNWLPSGNLFRNFHIVINEPLDSVKTSLKKNQISILTYNTKLLPFYVGAIDHLNHAGIRAKEIPTFIQDYDVLILEELFDHGLRNTVKKLLKNNFPYQTKLIESKPKGSKILTGGVIIFSRWPILKENQMVFQAATSIDQFAAKGATYAAINKQGKIYHIFGTHLQAGHTTKEVNVKYKQIKELFNFMLSQNISPKEPVLIGGDFNINRFKNDINVLLSGLQMDLHDNLGYPYSGDSTINTMSDSQDRALLDYIFTSQLHQKPLTASNKVFILRDLDNKKMWPNFDLSDHFPVAGYFEFGE